MLAAADAAGSGQPADAQPPDQQWPSWASPSPVQPSETVSAQRRPDRPRAPLPWETERPAADSIAELRLRLERLPDGHPSSPYADDGRMKLPVARLKDLELPPSADDRPATRAEPAGSAPAQFGDRPSGPGPSLPRPSVPGPSGHSPADGASRLLASQVRPGELPPGSNGPAADSLGTRSATGAGSPYPADPYALPPGDLGMPDGNGRNGRSSGPAAQRAADRSGGSIASLAPDVLVDPLRGTSSPAVDEPRSGEPQIPEPAEARTRPDGSWEWKGKHLTAEQNRIAGQALDKCRAAEGRNVFGSYREAGLTPAMRRIESQLDNCFLVPETDRYALKSPDRFKEKLADRIGDEPGRSAGELSSEIHDAVRYTFLTDKNSYSRELGDVRVTLEKAGYELLTLRNMWGAEEYKGVNSRWRDPVSAVVFEVQFHTHESWSAKQATHDAYEKITSPLASIGRKERLREEMRDISSAVPIPPRIREITDYRKDG